VPTFQLDGRLCARCKYAAMNRIGICSQCHSDRLLPARRGDRYVCASCAGTRGCMCTTCGADDHPIAKLDTCRRCVNRSRLIEVICDGAPPAGVAAQLVDSLSDAHPWSVTRMLRNGGDLVALLRTAAAGQRELSHDSLDALAPSRRVEHLRQRLIVDGLLPDRHHQLGLFDRWVRQFLASLPDGADRHTITVYATWHHRRRLAAKVDSNSLRADSTRAARRYIRVAAGFLAWLRSRGRSLDTCRQADLDGWFSSGPRTTRTSAIGFIIWAQSQRLCHPNLRVPDVRARTPDGLAHHERVELVSRLLYDETIPLPDRVAGLLVALFAQPVTRVSRLRIDAVVEADPLAIRFDTELVELPAPFDTLVRRLVEQRTASTSPWLFPGTTPGQPVSSHGLGERIRVHGVTKAARVAAFHDLVHKIPSPVLAALIGYNPMVVAVRASALASEWNLYAALRSQPGTDPPKDDAAPTHTETDDHKPSPGGDEVVVGQ
jgi:hypothetical protein